MVCIVSTMTQRLTEELVSVNKIALVPSILVNKENPRLRTLKTRLDNLLNRKQLLRQQIRTFYVKTSF